MLAVARSLQLAVVLAAGLASCACSRTAPDLDPALREEAARLLWTIDRLRQVPNQDKPRRLVELERAACSRADTCALKGRCTQAYRTFVRALAEISTAQSALPDPGQSSATLIEAEDDLGKAKQQMADCSQAQSDFGRRYRL